MAQRRARLKSGVQGISDFERNAAPPETGRRRIASARDRPPPGEPGGGRGRKAALLHDGKDSYGNAFDQAPAYDKDHRHIVMVA